MVFVNSFQLNRFVSGSELKHIISENLRERGIKKPWTLTRCDRSSACDGLRGFLGDHSKVTLEVIVEDELVQMKLFLKSVPTLNQAKVKFIEEMRFFTKEMLMYRFFQDMDGCEGPQAWHPRAYLCNEHIVVMPDLSLQNYKQVSQYHPLDLDHVLATTEAISRFHASSFNLETKRGLTYKQTYKINQGYEEALKETNFTDVPWLRACAKLTPNLLKACSKKYLSLESDLEEKLLELYLEACDSLTDYENTVNVLIHKDLWVNNIMYKYEGGAISAMLIDFQCARYGPPAFDLMTFLYLTTSRDFRRHHEEDIIRHYYTTFIHNLHAVSKDRAKSLGYSCQDFRGWCERARMFGIMVAVAIFPYVLMEPKTAQKTYDDPKTYHHYMYVDRSEPVINYAKESEIYKERNLEVSEEFYERYVLLKNV